MINQKYSRARRPSRTSRCADRPGRRAEAGGGAVKASNMVAATQANLVRLGYRPGPIDGRYGPRTRAATRHYQRDHKIQVDGKMSGQLALEVESQVGGLPQ